jgi:C-terminal peptidase prc
MGKHIFTLAMFFCCVGKLPALGISPQAPQKLSENDIGLVAHRLWVLSDIVLENHVDPPARQEMLLGGIRGLLKETGLSQPFGLSRRISTLTTEDHFKNILSEFVNKAPAAKVGKREQVEAAMVEELLASVPGPARLVPAEEIRSQEVISGNRYVGTGIQIRYDSKEQYTQIVNPFRRGPARRAGAKPGDLIVEVDGVDMKQTGVQKMVQTLRGPEGTHVTMVVRQPDSKEKRKLPMVRSVVPFDTVFGYRRVSEEKWRCRINPETPIAYVWISSVVSSTLHELRQVERQLQAEGVRALVLDLRLCEGGTLHDAALLAAGLLDSGLMWRVRDAHNVATDYRAESGCLFRDWPLAVLVHENAVGRSPTLVALALQNNGRATVVGESPNTHPYIDSLVDLPNGQGALMLRTGCLDATPARPLAARQKNINVTDPITGRNGINAALLQPDQRVSLKEAERQAVFQWLKDKQLPELPQGQTDEPPADPQLTKAIETLRAALKNRPDSDKTH